MDTSHPATLCESVLGSSWPVSAVPGPPRRPKGAQNNYSCLLAVWSPEKASGAIVIKFLLFGCQKSSHMGPPTGNGGAPGATSGPIFLSHMTLQYFNWVGPIFSSSSFAWRPHWYFWIGAGPPGAQKPGTRALLGPSTGKHPTATFTKEWHCATVQTAFLNVFL